MDNEEWFSRERILAEYYGNPCRPPKPDKMSCGACIGSTKFNTFEALVVRTPYHVMFACEVPGCPRGARTGYSSKHMLWNGDKQFALCEDHNALMHRCPSSVNRFHPVGPDGVMVDDFYSLLQELQRSAQAGRRTKRAVHSENKE